MPLQLAVASNSDKIGLSSMRFHIRSMKGLDHGSDRDCRVTYFLDCEIKVGERLIAFAKA